MVIEVIIINSRVENCKTCVQSEQLNLQLYILMSFRPRRPQKTLLNLTPYLRFGYVEAPQQNRSARTDGFRPLLNTFSKGVSRVSR